MIADMLSEKPAVVVNLLDMVPLELPFWKLQQRDDAINAIEAWFSVNMRRISKPKEIDEDSVRSRTVLTFVGPSGVGKTRMLHEVSKLIIPAGREQGYAVLPIMITLSGGNHPPDHVQSQSVSSQLAWHFLRAYLSASDCPDFFWE